MCTQCNIIDSCNRKFRSRSLRTVQDNTRCGQKSWHTLGNWISVAKWPRREKPFGVLYYILWLKYCLSGILWIWTSRRGRRSFHGTRLVQKSWHTFLHRFESGSEAWIIIWGGRYMELDFLNTNTKSIWYHLTMRNMCGRFEVGTAKPQKAISQGIKKC